MFVGCFEISISVISKHVQSIGCIINIFSAWGGTEEIAGLWFARGGINTQADTMNQKTFIPIHKQIAWNIMNAISCLN